MQSYHEHGKNLLLSMGVLHVTKSANNATCHVSGAEPSAFAVCSRRLVLIIT
jgi:hypothetical protein